MTPQVAGETTGTKLEDLKAPEFGSGKRADLIKQAEVERAKEQHRDNVCRIAAEDFVDDLIDEEVVTVAAWKRWRKKAEMLAQDIRSAGRSDERGSE